MTDTHPTSILDRLGAVKDAITVSRAFGDSYQADGVTVIPVATILGGGGGGGGAGTSGTDPQTAAPTGSGSGAGLGFGTIVRPIGVVVIRDGKVSWQPTIDVMRIVLGGQLLALAAILTVRRLLERH
jgi:uncharacterized spore protein YtfJ